MTQTSNLVRMRNRTKHGESFEMVARQQTQQADFL
jgi:hypothetical protein